MEKGTLRLLVYICVYVVYLCIGSLIFATIEAPIEEQEVAELKRLYVHFLNHNQCVDEHELQSYLLRIIKATKNGIKLVNNVTTVPNWNFASAFLFSGTLVTTIGYGDIAPLSTGGKVFAMFFALIGIPMTAVLLTAIVERLLRGVDWFEKYMEQRYLTQPGLPRSLIRAVNMSILIVLIVALVIFIPALLFDYTEDWDYFESLYFCFVTLTTIGLGDYTPGDGGEWVTSKYRDFYKIACVVYFLIGLSFVVLILEMCAKVPEDHPGMLFSCHKPVLDDGTEMEPLSSTPKPSYGRRHDNATGTGKGVAQDSNKSPSNDYRLVSGEDPDSNDNINHEPQVRN